MVRASLMLIGWMWAAHALASDDCPRRQTSPELESRIAAAIDAVDFQRKPDFLSMKLCGSGKYGWASVDTRHELQPDGSELWSRHWCVGGYRRGAWSCQVTKVRGIRVAVSGFAIPVQVTIPLEWPVAMARERVVAGFEAFGTLTIDRACGGPGPYDAALLENFRKDWKSDDFATFMLDSKGTTYSLSGPGNYFMNFNKAGFDCWYVEEIVVTGDTRIRAGQTRAVSLASTDTRADRSLQPPSHQ